VRLDVKVYMLLEARIISLLCAKNCEYLFRFLQVLEDLIDNIFEA